MSETEVPLLAVVDRTLALLDKHLREHHHVAAEKSSDFFLREAVKADADAIRSLYENEYDNVLKDFPEVGKYLRKELKKGTSAMYVAVDARSQAVVGMGGVRRTGHGSAQLVRLCVARGSRQHGIGAALIAKCVAFCRKLGDVSSLSASTVQNINEAAPKLYLKHDFKRVQSPAFGRVKDDPSLHSLQKGTQFKKLRYLWFKLDL